MRCPHCGHPDSRVINSRASQKGSAIRRRRECLSCAERFTTFEYVEKMPIQVIKSDGTREQFDRQKIIKGLLKACEKRGVALGTLERIADDVERTLQNSMEQEVASKRIGQLVLEQLREIDKVAYVRFASVYHDFRDVSEFSQEVQALLQRENTNRP
jgi:transcriptional repressor NrdR